MRILLWIFCLSGFLFSKEKEYVTCNFDGQLGNQLFQAATAIGYGLDHGLQPIFYRKGNTPNQEELKYVFHRFSFSKEYKKIAFQDIHEKIIYVHSELPYKKGKDIRLNGFFQTEKYFAKYAEVIRELLAPSQEIIDQIHEKYGALLSQPTVAVHVRTFIPDNRDPNREGFARYTWDYFMKAMDRFPDHYCFLVFSDAINWTKANFPCSRPNVHFVEGNRPYFDFYMMSLCDHQIVSPHSTFSWWAAWLNKNPHKVVLAPSIWGERTDSDTVCNGWVKIEAEQI